MSAGARAGLRLARARVDGGLRGPACASREARVPRWVRIWSSTDVCVMHAKMRIAPWPVGYASGSAAAGADHMPDSAADRHRSVV